MKRFFFLAGLVSAALALAGCARELDIPVSAKGDFDIILNAGDTRTVNDGMSTNWSENDALSVFYAPAGTTQWAGNCEFTVTDPETGHAKGSIGALTEESYDWYALYPYQSQNQVYKADTFFGGEAQVQKTDNDMSHLAGPTVPLFGRGLGVARDQIPSIQMMQASSVIRFDIQNKFDEAVCVKQITFTAPTDIVGEYTVNFFPEEPLYTAKDGSVSNTATLAVENPVSLEPDATSSFYLVVKPFAAASGETLTVQMVGRTPDGTKQAVVTKEIVLTADKTFHQGKIKTLKVPFGVEGDPYYEKVTSTSDVKDGKYLIVCEEYSVALREAVDAANNSTSVTLADGCVALTDETRAMAFTYTASSGFLMSSDGKFIGARSSSSLDVSSAGIRNEIEIQDGNARILSNNAYLRFNDSNDQMRFRYYARETMKPVQLYRLVNEGLVPAPGILSSIVLGGTPKSYFIAGDPYEFDGFVTAIYADGTSRDVTDLVNIVEPDMTVPERNKEVVVSYTEGGVTATATYTIFVDEDFSDLHTIYVSDYHATPFTAGDYTFRIQGGNETVYFNDDELRIYSGATLTVTNSRTRMHKIVFQLTGHGMARLAPITASTGTITPQQVGDHRVVWTGDAREVVFTVGARSDYGSEQGSSTGRLSFSEIYVDPWFDGTGEHTLHAIELEGQRTQFVIGEAFEFDGTVTAVYDDGSLVDVTSSTTFSGYDMTTAGTYTVTASFTDGGITKTSQYEIQVSQREELETYFLTITTEDFTTVSYVNNNKEHTSTAVTETGKSMEVVWKSNQVMATKNGTDLRMQWQKSQGFIESVTDLGTVTDIEIVSTQGTFTKTIDGGYFKIAVGSTTGYSDKVVISFKK
ncbi:MAG: fimbrillin family protein [Bacteroidales bacterium]|nr:fimbrillin family protein [Bacteroidales bacterium]